MGGLSEVSSSSPSALPGMLALHIENVAFIERKALKCKKEMGEDGIVWVPCLWIFCFSLLSAEITKGKNDNFVQEKKKSRCKNVHTFQVSA